MQRRVSPKLLWGCFTVGSQVRSQHDRYYTEFVPSSRMRSPAGTLILKRCHSLSDMVGYSHKEMTARLSPSSSRYVLKYNYHTRSTNNKDGVYLDRCRAKLSVLLNSSSLPESMKLSFYCLHPGWIQDAHHQDLHRRHPGIKRILSIIQNSQFDLDMVEL